MGKKDKSRGNVYGCTRCTRYTRCTRCTWFNFDPVYGPLTSCMRPRMTRVHPAATVYIITNKKFKNFLINFFSIFFYDICGFRGMYAGRMRVIRGCMRDGMRTYAGVCGLIFNPHTCTRVLRTLPWDLSSLPTLLPTLLNFPLSIYRVNPLPPLPRPTPPMTPTHVGAY